MVGEVAIVGGGPVGHCAALFLTDRGIPVTLIEERSEPYEDPRAATFHPPTLEMLAPSGATAELHRRGIVARHWQQWDRRHGLIADFDLALLADETPFPYRLQCEQHKLVEILREILRGRDLCTWRTGEKALSVTQSDGDVTIETDRGTVRARFAIGADGGRSLVRKSQGIDFVGFTYPERFLVITTDYDFAEEGYSYSCYIADPQEWSALFKVPGKGPPGYWRTVFPIDPAIGDEDALSLVGAREKIDRLVPRAKPYDILHTNIYKVHQRVAARFRKDRIFLVGDAAHVNNPLGGMGMNFGIHDAENLGRNLALFLEGGKSSDTLDLFDRQRRTVTERVLQTMTIQNKEALEERDPAATAARREELRATAADPALGKAFLLRTSMIEGLRAAANIR